MRWVGGDFGWWGGSWLGGFRQLDRDFDREGTAGKQHVGGLTIQRSSNWSQHAGPYRLANQLVSKRKVITVRCKDVGLNQFVNRFHEFSQGHPCHDLEIMEGKALAERRRKGCGSIRL